LSGFPSSRERQHGNDLQRVSLKSVTEYFNIYNPELVSGSPQADYISKVMDKCKFNIRRF
jgi:hypothetical protein